MVRRTPSRTRGSYAGLPLVTAIRPSQWTKNLLVFAALIFAVRFTQIESWLAAGAAFIVFCLLSSSGYLINDLLDVRADRRHPSKRLRPIASGALSRRAAVACAVIFVAIATGIALTIGPMFTAVALAYLVVSLLYSVLLKHFVLIDLFTIAAGFVLRAAGGAVAISVPISPWLYVCTALVALFLALGKRRHELVVLDASAGQHRRNLDDYTIVLVDQLTLVTTAATVIAYSLYTISAEGRPGGSGLMLTIPFVVYGLFRYLFLIHVRKQGGSPEELLLRDRPLAVTVIAWVAACALILYISVR